MTDIQETVPHAPDEPTSSQTYIERLEEEISRLRDGMFGREADQVKADSVTAEAQAAVTPPLLEGVPHPVNPDGTPDMKEPGPHQNPVSYVHLSNGKVVTLAGAIPTYLHVGEELLKVIDSHPMLAADGKQVLAGLLKSL